MYLPVESVKKTLSFIAEAAPGSSIAFDYIYASTTPQFSEQPFKPRGLNDSVKGKSDWKSIQTPFIFQKGQNPNKITLNLVVNGQGTVWIDDVVLLKAPLK